MLETVQELADGVAARLRSVRLDADLTQAGLAARSGVTLASLRRFETTGQIALESLIRLAQALGRDADIATLFVPPPAANLDELVTSSKPRRRGRRS
ncbi:helix-turn-helix domain-containing protein [Glacieibacterium megasporae]|uniref:helix-turn-helix domain-containing protein n=1 Tax=Glacieibacterium megasporae TaxID=2835787 RepID=UPI001C1DF028|nr:helix-turn-helix transcriptional regulator [Polymorphobacter megasporae]UAJ12487.1 helix-turn-helix domain-containing protein [Polymorphobacter megasporae]